MPREELFTIGEFSAITGVGIYSLRYYDEIGALKPEYVDPASNYRYYGFKQLSRIPAISICKDAGIKLSEFDSFLVNGSVDYDKLLEASRKAIKEIIDSCRSKERGFDQIEEFYTIMSKLGQKQSFTEKVRSLDIWTVPYEEISPQRGTSDMLVKLSESAAGCGRRIMPSAYGVLRTREADGFRDYAFSMLADQDKTVSANKHHMVIPGGEYLFAVMGSCSIDRSAELMDAHAGERQGDQVLSLALISGDTSGPLYCAATRLSD